jgi:hypothetical protein
VEGFDFPATAEESNHLPLTALFNKWVLRGPETGRGSLVGHG